jgi:D-aminopeptidase
VAGTPVGSEIPDDLPAPIAPGKSSGNRGSVARGDAGSVIAVVATDAPLLPHQLKRLARRVSMGLARTGSSAANGSGDIFIAFSTANPDAAGGKVVQVEMLDNNAITPLFDATIQATEEAVINALMAAETMVGRDGNRVVALPHGRLQEVLRKYNRL